MVGEHLDRSYIVYNRCYEVYNRSVCSVQKVLGSVQRLDMCYKIHECIVYCPAPVQVSCSVNPLIHLHSGGDLTKRARVSGGTGAGGCSAALAVPGRDSVMYIKYLQQCRILLQYPTLVPAL